jgi:hypothetical protein
MANNQIGIATAAERVKENQLEMEVKSQSQKRR